MNTTKQKQNQGQSFNLRPKLTFRRKLVIMGFALYVTFILLSVMPYLAEQEFSRGKLTNGEYESHLIFPEDGAYGHYTNVILEVNKSLKGKIDISTVSGKHIILLVCISTIYNEKVAALLATTYIYESFDAFILYY